MFDSDHQYFITSRTFQGRYLMKPTPEIRELIGALLARAVRRYDVNLFGYVFMSNHFHLIIDGAPAAIPAFVGWLKREISVHVGRRLWGWTGGFWDRRYDAEEIVDEAALEEKLRYIASHGVKEGLVLHADEWPGLHCIHQLGSDEPLEFKYPQSSREPGRVERLELQRLPHWRELSRERYREVAGVFRRDVELIGKRVLVGRKPLGLDRIRERPFDFRPEAPKRSVKPKCHASTLTGYVKHKIKREAFARHYDVASAAYRAGDFGVSFPRGAFRPPLPPFATD